MADLPESSVYEAGIRQLETSDPVQGGANGVANTQAKQLANRTRWLKEWQSTHDPSLDGHSDSDIATDAHGWVEGANVDAQLTALRNGLAAQADPAGASRVGNAAASYTQGSATVTAAAGTLAAQVLALVTRLMAASGARVEENCEVRAIEQLPNGGIRLRVLRPRGVRHWLAPTAQRRRRSGGAVAARAHLSRQQPRTLLARRKGVADGYRCDDGHGDRLARRGRCREFALPGRRGHGCRGDRAPCCGRRITRGRDGMARGTGRRRCRSAFRTRHCPGDPSDSTTARAACQRL